MIIVAEMIIVVAEQTMITAMQTKRYKERTELGGGRQGRQSSKL